MFKLAFLSLSVLALCQFANAQTADDSLMIKKNLG